MYKINNTELVEIAYDECVMLDEYERVGNERTIITITEGLDIHDTLYILAGIAVILKTKNIII